MLHSPAQLMYLDVVTLLNIQWNINYKSVHYVIFSVLLLLFLTKVQIFFSAPCSQTPYIYYN